MYICPRNPIIMLEALISLDRAARLLQVADVPEYFREALVAVHDHVCKIVRECSNLIDDIKNYK